MLLLFKSVKTSKMILIQNRKKCKFFQKYCLIAIQYYVKEIFSETLVFSEIIICLTLVELSIK